MTAQKIANKDVLEALEGNEEFALVDVRSASAYAKGHIPGAVNLPFNAAGPEYYEALYEKDQRIVTYCYIGVASLKVANALVDAGFTNVASMSGGHTAWRFLKGAPADERS